MSGILNYSVDYYGEEPLDINGATCKGCGRSVDIYRSSCEDCDTFYPPKEDRYFNRVAANIYCGSGTYKVGENTSAPSGIYVGYASNLIYDEDMPSYNEDE